MLSLVYVVKWLVVDYILLCLYFLHVFALIVAMLIASGSVCISVEMFICSVVSRFAP